MSSVRYGTRLGDLKENWFFCFPIKHSTHTCDDDDLLSPERKEGLRGLGHPRYRQCVRAFHPKFLYSTFIMETLGDSRG